MTLKKKVKNAINRDIYNTSKVSNGVNTGLVAVDFGIHLCTERVLWVEYVESGGHLTGRKPQWVLLRHLLKLGKG
jgi:hypothetical protein